MTDKKAKRPERVPLHRRKVLAAKERPGYVRRFVNEEAGRVQDFLAAGWTPVSGSEDESDARVQKGSILGSVVRRVVNKDKDARYNTAVLMEIPEELYNEDQVAKRNAIQQNMDALDPKKRRVAGADYGNIKIDK